MSTSAPRASRALAGLGALVSVAAVAAVVLWALHQDAPRFPSTSSDLTALGIAIALYLAGCAVRGERWHILLRHNHATPDRVDSYGLIAVGNLGNNLLPARAGDALRVVFMTPRARTDARTVVGTLVAERVMDVVVLVGLFVVLAYGVLGGVDVPSGGRVAAAALLVAAILAALALAALVLHRHGRLTRIIAFLAPMAAATRRLRGRHGAEVLALTLLVWIAEWGAWYATAQAAGLGVSVLEVGYLLGVSSVFVLIPSGPGYAGTLDAAIVFGVRAVGQSGTAALSYLLLLRFVVFVPITLIGLAVLVLRYHGMGIVRSRAARA